MIPLLILILLITLGIFRWDKGPSQSFEGSIKIQYLTDRWTGQQWLKLYGSLPDAWSNDSNDSIANILKQTIINPYSAMSFAGNMYPHFSPNSIAKKVKTILAGNKGIAKRQQLEEELQTANNAKTIHAEGHTEYLRLEKTIRNKEYLTPSTSDILYTWKTRLERNQEMAKAIAKEMPQQIVYERNAWIYENLKIKQIHGEINDLPAWSDNEAKKELTSKAQRTKNVATIIWVVLIAISLVMTIVLYLKPKRSNTMLDKSA